MTEREAMAQALALAVLGEGTTRPNPLVGCLVLAGDEVVGTGYHRAAGEPHAEAVALDEAGGRARGGTLVVTLEPCAHQGRTPPCADAIIRAGIRRVVAGTGDPNPLVNGEGVRRLRAAGIEVVLGVLEDACRAVNAGFLSLHERRRPFVTVKAAQSLDGQIAARDGSATWITREAARTYAHRLRLRHDAVLVGASTVRRDDPRLTVRLPGVAAPRLRVVVASTLDLDPAAAVFDGTPRTRVYVPDDAKGGDALARVADLVRVPRRDAGVDLAAVLSDLAALDVRSVLVEGGGRTIGAFFAAGLADDLALFVAPRVIGATEATPLAALRAAPSPDESAAVRVRATVPLGIDRLILGSIECSPV
ncbi:MAG TPA: bifunctional diaminohydroxyphosphoribosylaminopyrimidine deaminase/5-amino-6-(5-phosphoribosylamino)uracil reductase RibD [Candidatus Polarisedimenticolaceae bacterium]|nr:bifunctional diaminohydroxyphosphoribosylaminopyrimidine deaminase/5-amino-6-(5-phosphoribosylamino)uracil reductase RibD [Candidatus Polarisedimenticolaceae bacterium]